LRGAPPLGNSYRMTSGLNAAGTFGVGDAAPPLALAIGVAVPPGVPPEDVSSHALRTVNATSHAPKRSGTGRRWRSALDLMAWSSAQAMPTAPASG